MNQTKKGFKDYSIFCFCILYFKAAIQFLSHYATESSPIYKKSIKNDMNSLSSYRNLISLIGILVICGRFRTTVELYLLDFDETIGEKIDGNNIRMLHGFLNKSWK